MKAAQKDGMKQDLRGNVSFATTIYRQPLYIGTTSTKLCN